MNLPAAMKGIEVMEMRAEMIKREVARLKSKYHTSSTREVCDAMGIRISRQSMGTSAGSCKGFFLIHSRRKIAVINHDLEMPVQEVILAHELAHCVLHADSRIRAFHEVSYLDETDSLEREANIFAAEFLVDDGELFEVLQQDQDFFAVASTLQVPPELLDFKLRLLNQQGHQVQAPYIAKADFLRRDLHQPFS